MVIESYENKAVDYGFFSLRINFSSRLETFNRIDYTEGILKCGGQIYIYGQYSPNKFTVLVELIFILIFIPAGAETFQKRCFNISFYVVWKFLECHFWKVYLTLEVKPLKNVDENVDPTSVKRC